MCTRPCVLPDHQSEAEFECFNSQTNSFCDIYVAEYIQLICYTVHGRESQSLLTFACIRFVIRIV